MKKIIALILTVSFLAVTPAQADGPVLPAQAANPVLPAQAGGLDRNVVISQSIGGGIPCCFL